MSLCKIGVITYGRDLQDRYPDLGKRENCEILFHHARYQPGLEAAHELMEQDVDVILTDPNTSVILNSMIKTPCVPLFMDNFTLLRAIFKSKEHGSRVALMQFENPARVYDLEMIQRMLGLPEAKGFYIRHPDEIESTIKQILTGGFDVMVTTIQELANLAIAAGLPSLVISSEERELLRSLEIAKTIAKEKRNNMIHLRFREMISNSLDIGLISLNMNNTVESLNYKAEQLLKIPVNQLKGQTVDFIIQQYPQMKSVLTEVNHASDSSELEFTDFIIHRQPVINDDSEQIGTIIQMTEIRHLQSLEMESRQMSRRRGFFAKSNFKDIAGVSTPLQQCIKDAKRYALSSANILICGESGTGKEIFSQSIHNHSHYKNGPFLAINCATVPENLLESELFGYEEGTFTGAKKGGRAGMFEMAHNGTLFLDEIGEIPLHLQSKLLRVLEERTVRRLGGSSDIPVDTRIISATNRNLRSAMESGTFREDLYYRLNVLYLNLPSLRERKEDVIPIAKALYHHAARQEGTVYSVPEVCWKELIRYNWYGNVRELRNFIERLVILIKGGEFSPAALRKMVDDLIVESRHLNKSAPEHSNRETITLPIDNLKTMQDEMIRHVYEMCGGNRQEMCRVLGISNATLWRRLKELGLPSGRAPV